MIVSIFDGENMRIYNNVIIEFATLSVVAILISCPVFALQNIVSLYVLILIYGFTAFTAFNALLFFRARRLKRPLFYKNEFKISLQLKDVVILIGLQILMKLLHLVCNLLFPQSATADYSPDIISLLSIIILAPIIEEWIFRGVFLKSLLTKYSVNKSIIISSALFAVVHINPLQIIGAFVVGCYLGSVYAKSKSISNVIILHSIANAFGLLLTYYF